MSSPTTRLSELPAGSSAQIDNLDRGVASMTRLREMGLVPGTRVKVVRRAPLGEPLEICVRGSTLAMRNADAAHVSITSILP